jgi:hypothetical protein
MNAQPELPNLVRGWLALPRQLRRTVLVTLLAGPIVVPSLRFSGLYFLSAQAAIDASVPRTQKCEIKNKKPTTGIEETGIRSLAWEGAVKSPELFKRGATSREFPQNYERFAPVATSSLG